jgi:hypothetical protein
MKKVLVVFIFIIISVLSYSQATLTSGMTSTQFISVINANFNSLGVAEGVDTLLTTITKSSPYTVINNNFDTLSKYAPASVNIIRLKAGIKGRTYISSINTNFTSLTTSINTVFTQNNSLYVSNSGNDNTGNGSYLNPYATLSKISTVLTDNTIVNIAKGSTFINDKLDLSGKTNVFVDSYGTGSAPILTGLQSVSGWTNEGGNIWSKQDNNFPDVITNVFSGSTKYNIARSAQKTVTTGGDSTFVDSALTDANGTWDNAEIYVIIEQYLLSISRCKSYSNKTFNISPLKLATSKHPVQPPFANLWPVLTGNHYFIQNHRSLLAGVNQWAYNNSTKTLYVFSLSSPLNMTVSYGDDCIYANHAKLLTIQNLAINGADRCGVQINNSSYVNIRSSTFNYAGYYSVLVRNSKTIIIDGLTCNDQNSDGISVIDNNNVFLQIGRASCRERV